MYLLASCLPSSGGLPAPIVATVEVGTAVAITVMPGGGYFTPAPFPTPEPPTLIPTLPSALSPTELKYRLLAQYPDFFFCDPDYYPIARADEKQLAIERFPELQANAEEFQSILSHNGLSGVTTFTDDQKLLIYREHKKLAAIYFELAGDKYQFQIQTGTEGQQGFVVKGAIDGNGNIHVDERNPGYLTCPICLAVHTLIDTPNGAVYVEDLKVGDAVWTMNAAGQRVQAVILQTARVFVPATHEMVHAILSDGREIWASPGHPTADGRRLGDLKVGDALDNARITFIERMPYDQPATYDILPSGDTGFYWANGILLGSTLRH
jgi:hypothetical protein